MQFFQPKVFIHVLNGHMQELMNYTYGDNNAYSLPFKEFMLLHSVPQAKATSAGVCNLVISYYTCC